MIIFPSVATTMMKNVLFDLGGHILFFNTKVNVSNVEERILVAYLISGMTIESMSAANEGQPTDNFPRLTVTFSVLHSKCSIFHHLVLLQLESVQHLIWQS